MLKKINIAIEIAEPRGARELLDTLKDVPSTETTQWFNGSGEKGALAVKLVPDIVIIDDQPATSRSCIERIERLRQSFPQTAIFVVSSDTRPEHIVEVMKSGVAQYLLQPVGKKSLLDAIEEVRSRLSNAGKPTRGMVLSFISSKGGLGATVIAVNTAVAFARRKDVTAALYDMSFQAGDASVLLDLTAPTTILDLCRNVHRLDHSFIRGAVCRHTSGLEFLPSPANPEDSEEIASEHIGRIIALSRQLYDVVSIDCTSMRVDERTMEVFKLSDKLFIITDLSVTAVRNAARLCQLVERLGLPADKIKVVINRFIRGGTLPLEEVEKTLQRRIYWAFPNDFDDIVTSINQGEPLVVRQPNAPFAKNTLEFVDKLFNPHADTQYRGIRGAFGKAL